MSFITRTNSDFYEPTGKLPRFVTALPPVQAYNSFLIYAKSALIEQTTPEIHSIYDAKAGISW